MNPEEIANSVDSRRRMYSQEDFAFLRNSPLSQSPLPGNVKRNNYSRRFFKRAKSSRGNPRIVK